jgi:Lsr2
VAKQTQWILVDDLDGSPASTTVEFGLDGQSYAVDLSAENAAKLRAALAEFVAAARERQEPPASAQRQASLRRTSQARTTVVAPAPRSAPPPSLLGELVEVVRDLAADVRRALLEILTVALDVLREQLAARRPHFSRGATTGGDGRE